MGNIDTDDDDEDSGELDPRDGFVEKKEGEGDGEDRLEIGENGGFRGLDTVLAKKIKGETNDGTKEGHIDDGKR